MKNESRDLTSAELKALRKNADEDSKKIREFVYDMNGGPHPLNPIC